MARKRNNGDEYVYRFAPTNDRQIEAWEYWQKEDRQVVALLGPAGTGKTHIAFGLALDYSIRHEVPIVITRPLVTCDEDLGFLKGSLQDKIAPWLAPVGDILPNLTYSDVTGRISFAPLAYLRGRTIDGVMILDEAQNCTYDQLKLFLSRIGKQTKVIITGDPNQIDIRNSGFKEVIGRCADIFGTVIFTRKDNQRAGIVADILERLERK